MATRSTPRFSTSACMLISPSWKTSKAVMGRRIARVPCTCPSGWSAFACFAPARRRGGPTSSCAEGRTHVVRSSRGNVETPSVDIRVSDPAGRPIALLEGLSVRRLPPWSAHSTNAYAPWLYRVRWEERSHLAPHPLNGGTAPPMTPVNGGETFHPTSVNGSARPGRERTAPSGEWLVFADRGGVGAALAALLARRGEATHLVFARDGADRRGGRRAASDSRRRGTAIDPTRASDVREVVGEALAGARPCRGVVYLWPLDRPALDGMTMRQFARAEALGAGGALFVVRALSDLRPASGAAPRLWLVTQNGQAVEPAWDDGAPIDHARAGRPMESVQAPGDRTEDAPVTRASLGPVEPLQAMLWGLGRTVALEATALWGALVDLDARA